MPFEIMDQRGLPASSHIYDDIFRSESNGLWQPKNTHDNLGTAGINEMGASPGGILGTSSHGEQIDLQLRQINPPRELAEKQLLSREEGFANTVNLPNKSFTQHLKQPSNTMIHPISVPYSLGGTKIVTDAGSHESSLFSSSLSEIFTCKMSLSGNDVLSHQPACTMVSNDGEESYGCHKKVEPGHIGNILPDEDDLFSGVIDDLGFNADANTNTDFEDFDLFSSGGGLELEEDNLFASEKRNNKFGGINCLGGISGKQQLGKYPSRTLLVRNISNNIVDSELTAVFKQFGDIRTLYTACKHRGFVMISYYDLRAAQNAMRALQNKPLHHRNLDIHFSVPKDNSPEKDINHGILILSDLDPSVSNDKLQHIFGFYGEIKDICEIPEKHQVKLIEFYDVRAADSALRELNGSQIAGKQIKLEPGCPGGAIWCLMQQSQKGRDGHNIQNNFPSLHHAISSRQNTHTYMEMGSSPGLYPSIQQTMNAFTVNSLPNGNRNSSLANALPTPVGSPSTGKLFGVSETNCFLGTKAASGPRFHPHSFPEFCDTLVNDASYNSSIMDIGGNISSGLAEGIDGRCIQDLSSSANLMDFGGGFESSGNGNYTPHGLHHIWNKSNMHQQHLSSHMVWQNSPPFVNGSCAPRLLKMSGFPRVPHHMLRTPNVDHHVGSAPVVNGSPWDMRHSNLGESPDASSFHLGSLGSAGFPGTWQLYPAEVSAQNMYPHVAGNPVDMIANTGQLSSKQVSCLFPVRNPAMSISRHDAANERSRNQYHRRSDSNSANTDKKQFELDIDRILRGEDNRTTLMIKNIPNKYTSKMLLAAIDEQCRGTYDFIYLPIDFKNKCNVGYAFINMIDPSQIVPFYQAFNGKKWEKFNSEKVASLAYARIQGKAALIAHFQNSSLMNEDKRCRPILFHTDGPNAGDPEPFPMGTNSRARPGKFRSCSNDEYRHQGNPSAPVSGDESTNGADSSLASANISN